MNNKLLIAAAGAGKTTYLVRRALEIKDESVLILTYTIENEQEIRSKFLEINISDRCVPANITIKTWFSFLIQHGVKPYQGKVYSKSIKFFFKRYAESKILCGIDTGKIQRWDRVGGK